MRIAMMTNNYKPFIGGVPISIERLSMALRSLGHQVFIFAPEYEGQEYEEDIIRYKALKHKLSKSEMVIPNMFARTIEKKFKELEIDIIHVHHPMLIGWTALYLGEKYKIPVTYTYHTRFERYIHYVGPFGYLEEKSKGDEEKLTNELSKALLTVVKDKVIPWGTKAFANSCNTVFAPTESMKDYLRENGVISNIEILPTGLAKNYFYEDKSKAAEIRNKYIKDKKYLFCTVSRLAKEKNIEFILEGLKRLKKETGDCFNALIIGDGPLKEKLMAKAMELNIQGSIEFLNSIPNEEIGHYYRACDMFLFASTSETQGIVLLEAMAAGNPVIAIEGSGVIEVVENGCNGFMTSNNIEEWVSRIEYVMNNRDIYEKLKEGAYGTAKKYSNESIGRAAEYFYRETIRKYDIQGNGGEQSKNIPLTESYK